MPQPSLDPARPRVRRIVERTRGHARGPVTRLNSPSDLGQVLRPFVLLDLFAVAPEVPARLDLHPHSGIATLTALTSGAMSYRRRDGEPASLAEGDIEWMLAGGGVWHGSPLTAPARAKGFQPWVALPPGLEDAPSEEVFLTRDDIAAAGPARVLLGEHEGVRSPVAAPAPMACLHVTLMAGESWTFEPPEGHDVAWIALDEGRAGGEAAGEPVAFEDGPAPIRVRAIEPSSFVLGSALGHPRDLAAGHHSVRTNAASLARGEARIANLGAESRRAGHLGGRPRADVRG